MKIMWFTNVLLPQAAQAVGLPIYSLGGWLQASSKALELENNINLVLVGPHEKEERFSKYFGKYSTLYVTRILDKDTISRAVIREIITCEAPDIIHVYGTEKVQSYEIIQIAKQLNVPVILNIQGLVGTIAKHYYANLPVNIVYGATFRNIIKRDTVYNKKIDYEKLSKREDASIRNVDFVLGRTTWDEAYVKLKNPQIMYFRCNEILRDSFYQSEWDISQINRYQIICSQAHYPIKGIHYVIEALAIVVKQYPNTQLVITGHNLFQAKGFSNLKLSKYSKYINRLISKYKLQNNIKFTGIIDETTMVTTMQSSHLFISSSTIENESNSLSEARLLGLPVIASYVGGVIDRIKHGIDGFYYQHDAPYMLAHYILKVFNDDNLASTIGQNARKEAFVRNNIDVNNKVLINVYNHVYELSNNIK